MLKNLAQFTNNFNKFAVMISVVIIGGGNVAFHLAHAFSVCKKIRLRQIYVRNITSVADFQENVPITGTIHLLSDADVYIIAVSDDAISEVSSELSSEKFVVHTSGSVAMNALKNEGKKGVFYPLQSFSKTKDVNFKEIPVCLEADHQDDLKFLENLASLISNQVFYINSEQRSKLHVAAVFVNNFVNHIYKMGNDICEEHEIPFEVLFPLIKETASKIEYIHPKNAQTGPAKRNDQKTIKRHLEILNTQQKEIYQLITKSIQDG